jgi:hypothetical protein
MSLNIDETDGVTLNKIKLKYLSTKKDSYGNENLFYVIEADDFYDIVATVPKEFKVPWFKGEKSTILKVKSRWVKGNKKATTGGTGNVSMKEYDFEGTKGYYVCSIAFK